MGVPYWVTEAYGEFTSTEPRDGINWEEDDPKRWSHVVSIHYPPIAMVYFVVDVLKPDHEDARSDGWYELQGSHFSQELAENAAKKRAYNDNVPHRVRMVVWDG